MRRLIEGLGWLMLAGIALTVIVAAVCAAWGLPCTGNTQISFDGDALTVSSLSIGAVLLALAIVVTVLLVAVAAPLLALGFALAGVALALAGVASVLFSPLLLLAGAIWLIWRVARGGSAGATIRG
jgi:hypothetical protein